MTAILNKRSAASSPETASIALQTRSLSVRFGKNDVLSGVDMTVPAGAVYALLGRNGVGKSTLLQIALGLLKQTSGEISVLCLDPHRQGSELLERVGYIPERLPLYDWMTIAELLAFTAAQYKRWSKDEEERLVSKFRLNPKKRVRELSRGNLALLALVLAMSHQPDLVLLDECTSGMDAIHRAEFDRTVIETLQETRRTVVFASHQIRELEFLSDWVGIIDDGKLIVQSPVEDLKASVKTLRLRNVDDVPPPFPGELGRQKLGREWLVTVRDFNSIPDDRRSAIAEMIDLSLEEIFVALVQDREERS
jgi:ABC-2 type transport system ATP-binding protein